MSTRKNVTVDEIATPTVTANIDSPPNVSIIDNASWHKTKRLQWHHIHPVYLPPYSPDFNPIERLWQRLKSHYMAGFLTNNSEQLHHKIVDSIYDLLQRPKSIRSIYSPFSF